MAERKKKLLSALSVWALTFGCVIGWGAFVMPGTTFLPSAGPLGTVLAKLPVFNAAQTLLETLRDVLGKADG